MAVEFGTPETWGMKVGEFLESKEYTIPQPKPQDVIEQRRKDSLRKFLFDYPGAVEQETVDYIKREELAKGTGGSFKDYINRGDEYEDFTFEEWLREDKAEGGRIGFKDGKLSMTPEAIKQRRYREKNPYKLKMTDIVADGVKYTIPNNAMKPESAKGFIKFLNKLEKDPTIENYGRLVKGLPKDVANQVRNYRYYLQGIKSGSFSGVDRKTGEKLKQLYQELNLPKQSTNLLSKITTKDIKGQVIKTATKAAGEAAKSGSMDVVNAVRDIFVNDPNNAPSLDEVAEGLEGTKKFNAASESERIKMRTKASNAVTQFLGAVTADRKVKGFKDVADETLGDIIQYIDENKRGEFRFAEGQIRNYKIKLRDSLLKGDFEKQRRKIPGGKGKVVDEVFGLSATFEDAPGYTENVQVISDKVNKLKRTQIDKPFAAILKAVKQGKDVVQYGGDRSVPISKAVKDFNAKSKTFSNKNKVSTPQIFIGDDLDATKIVSNFKDYSPQAQKNILDLADEGFVLSSTKPATPAGKLNFKPGMQEDGRLVDLPGGQSKGFLGGPEMLKSIGKGALTTAKVLGQPSIAAAFAADELSKGNIKTAGASLLAPELVGSFAPAGKGILSTIGRIAANPFGRAARAFTPVGLATLGAGALYDVYKEYERREALTDEERLEEDLERDRAYDETMIGAADGGIIRLGLADGPKKKGLKNPGRREFMKTTGKLAGIAALLPYGIGKGIKIATKAAPAVSEGVKLGIDKLMLLVDKIKLLGRDVTPRYGTKEREQVTLYQGKDGASYELVEDISTGDIRVTRDVEGGATYGDKSYDTIEDRTEFQIRKGEVYVKDEGLETQKAIQAPDEYEEGRAVFDQDGTVADVDDVDDAVIDAIDDEIK